MTFRRNRSITNTVRQSSFIAVYHPKKSYAYYIADRACRQAISGQARQEKCKRTPSFRVECRYSYISGTHERKKLHWFWGRAASPTSSRRITAVWVRSKPQSDLPEQARVEIGVRFCEVRQRNRKSLKHGFHRGLVAGPLQEGPLGECHVQRRLQRENMAQWQSGDLAVGRDKFDGQVDGRPAPVGVPAGTAVMAGGACLFGIVARGTLAALTRIRQAETQRHPAVEQPIGGAYRAV